MHHHRRQRPRQQRPLRPQLQRRGERDALARPALACATTSVVGPSQTPSRQASSEPSTPPTPAPTTSGTPPRRRDRKTSRALTSAEGQREQHERPVRADRLLALGVLQIDAPCRPRPAAPAAPATATAARAARPRPRPRCDDGGLHQLGPQLLLGLRVLGGPGLLVGIRLGGAPARPVRPVRRCPARASSGTVVRRLAGGVSGAVTPTSCQARLAAARHRTAARRYAQVATASETTPDPRAHREVTADRRPVGCSGRRSGRRPPRRTSTAADPARTAPPPASGPPAARPAAAPPTCPAARAAWPAPAAARAARAPRRARRARRPASGITAAAPTGGPAAAGTARARRPR